VEACVHGALAIKGNWFAASDVIARAQRMRPFFEHSGGGITLSGGEVTAQAEFGAAVLSGCQAQDIHTAIETCGAASWDRLGKLAQHSDLILYDIKLLDEDAHRRWTGAPNKQILDNVRRLTVHGHSVQIRVPLIPGITDTRENLCAIAAFVRDVGLTQIVLLPYNESASAKYEWLDRPYEIAAEPGQAEQLDALLQVVRAAGLDAIVG
jgi:pyruvate formate lyase activating enzyme